MTLNLKPYILPLCAAGVALLLAIFHSELNPVFAYDRSLIADGELWRLITGNWMHTNWTHFALNMGGLALIWLVYNDLANFRWQLSFLLIPMLGCTLLLLAFSPDMERYVGLSGGLHGTIVAFGIADYTKNRLLSILLVIGVSAKLIYEQLTGSSETIEQLIAANVAIDAHLWGAISGLILGLVYLLTHKTQLKTEANSSDKPS